MSNKSTPASATGLLWLQVAFSTAGLSPAEIEDMAFALMVEHHAEGTVQESNTTLIAYFQLSRSACENIVTGVCREYSVSAAIEEVAEQNWCAASEQVWQPIEEGILRVQPVATESMVEPPAPGEIRIYPGTGFGTGQHHTTRMLLRMMQDPILAAANPTRLLDVGTGSGILAIAAAHLFTSEITAFDTDQLATGNAEINLALNHCDSRISLFTGSISDCAGQFDLLFANLYAELLLELEPQLRARGVPGGYILLSGILKELWPEVKRGFESNGAITETVYFSDELYTLPAHEKVWTAACLRWGKI